MKIINGKGKNNFSFYDVPDDLHTIQLFPRAIAAKLLGIGISHLDKIPESLQKKTRIGRSVRYSWDSINDFIKESSSGN